MVAKWLTYSAGPGDQPHGASQAVIVPIDINVTLWIENVKLDHALVILARESLYQSAIAKACSC